MTCAIILAAGRGSRMGKLTDHQPKCFARLHGRRLLDWQLDALRGAGLARIGLVRGYRGECFDEPLTYFDNPHWARSNMLRTLLAAQDWLASEPCIVSYSDIVYSAATVRALLASPADLAISYDPQWLVLWSARFSDPLEDAESFSLDAEGRLQTIGERCQSLEQIQGQYMGLLKFTPAGWQRVRQLLQGLDDARIDRLDMTSLLRLGLAAGWQIDAVAVQGPWGEVDEAGDLALYQRLITPQALAAGVAS